MRDSVMSACVLIIITHAWPITIVQLLNRYRMHNMLGVPQLLSTSTWLYSEVNWLHRIERKWWLKYAY